MRYSISNTAEYGDLTRGKRVIGEPTRAAMKEILGEIQSGDFAREWIAENKAGQENFKRMREEESHHQVEEEGKKLRVDDGLDRHGVLTVADYLPPEPKGAEPDLGAQASARLHLSLRPRRPRRGGRNSRPSSTSSRSSCIRRSRRVPDNGVAVTGFVLVDGRGRPAADLGRSVEHRLDRLRRPGDLLLAEGQAAGGARRDAQARRASPRPVSSRGIITLVLSLLATLLDSAHRALSPPTRSSAATSRTTSRARR